MIITSDKAVSFHYTLRNSEGEQLESSKDKEPLSYLHGAGNIIPGLENALEGKSIGDQFEATIPPAEAYGERTDASIQRIASKYLKNPRKLEPGQIVVLQTKQGPTQVTVVKVGRFNVDVDTSHPLAGQTLTFEVEITEVRDATEEELQHGHIHGPGGVEH
jgi:FKBP-type peptidyl-prolyl cis-trans isomerase SlyD